MAKTVVFWLNAFPVLGGVSWDLSPRTILMGQKVDYKHHCHFQFGEYTQTHEEHNNSMNLRTVGALALRPAGNGQGRVYFLSVSTGRVLNRLHATALPMPDDIIDKIHRMARQQKNNPGLIFADRNLNPMSMTSMMMMMMTKHIATTTMTIPMKIMMNHITTTTTMMMTTMTMMMTMNHITTTTTAMMTTRRTKMTMIIMTVMREVLTTTTTMPVMEMGMVLPW